MPRRRRAHRAVHHGTGPAALVPRFERVRDYRVQTGKRSIAHFFRPPPAPTGPAAAADDGAAGAPEEPEGAGAASTEGDEAPPDAKARRSQ